MPLLILKMAGHCRAAYPKLLPTNIFKCATSTPILKIAWKKKKNVSYNFIKNWTKEKVK